MPNVNDLNEYITPQDVADGDLLVFTNAGKIVDVDYSPNKDGSDVVPVLQIQVRLPSGKTKLISPNKTSRTAISNSYTPATEKWIGQAAKVTLIKQMVRGTFRNVIYLEPVENRGLEELSDPQEPTDPYKPAEAI